MNHFIFVILIFVCGQALADPSTLSAKEQATTNANQNTSASSKVAKEAGTQVLPMGGTVKSVASKAKNTAQTSDSKAPQVGTPAVAVKAKPVTQKAVATSSQATQVVATQVVAPTTMQADPADLVQANSSEVLATPVLADPTTPQVFSPASTRLVGDSIPLNHPLNHAENKLKGFFEISLGHEAQPIYYFEYYDTVLSFRYGGEIADQHGFAAGVQWNIQRSIMLMFKYNYDFVQDQKWIPGVDTALLIGGGGSRGERGRRRWLDAGLNLGAYIKTFVSSRHVLFLRSGLAYDTSQFKPAPYLPDIRIYINLGVQWNF